MNHNENYTIKRENDILQQCYNLTFKTVRRVRNCRFWIEILLVNPTFLVRLDMNKMLLQAYCVIL